MLHCTQPARILLSKKGYSGTFAILAQFKRSKPSLELLYIEDGFGLGNLTTGDLVYIESPTNPTGELTDLAQYKKEGVWICVDSTFAPPPLQFLTNAADFVVHSSTKFLGGHSDLLGGVILTRNAGICEGLRSQRTIMGNVMGALESWLLIRSLRTLKIRVWAQSESAFRIAKFLSACSCVQTVHHCSILGQTLNGGGYPGVIAITVMFVILILRCSRGRTQRIYQRTLKCFRMQLRLADVKVWSNGDTA